MRGKFLQGDFDNWIDVISRSASKRNIRILSPTLLLKGEETGGGRSRPPKNIHLPSSAFSTVNSTSSASTIIFATARNDPNVYSVPVLATVADVGALFSVISAMTKVADGAGHIIVGNQ